MKAKSRFVVTQWQGPPHFANQTGVAKRAFLKLLSGRRHRVITAIAVKHKAGIIERDVESAVR